MEGIEKVIEGLEFTKAMITFNPSSGEDIEPGNLNEADKTTYDACVGAIALLKEQQAEIAQLRNDAHARRCKDCRKRNQHKECKEGYGYHSDDWFCADFDPSDEAVLEAFAEDG